MFNIRPSMRACAVFILLSPAIFAASNVPHYPMPISKHVSDYVGILQSSDSMAITGKLADFERRTGIECTVVIIDSVSRYAEEMGFETFATNLFNTWGIGNRYKNNGILLLIATQDRAVRIELGSGYEESCSSIATSIIDNTMVPLLKQNNWGSAVIKGCDTIMKQLGSERSSPLSGILIFLAFLLIAGFFLCSWLLVGDENDQTNGTPNHPYAPRTHYFRTRSSGSKGSFGGGRSSGRGGSGRF